MPEPRYTTYIRFAGAFSLIIGVLVLIGWQFNIELLKSIVPGFIAMNPLTAIGFILTGSWLLLVIRDFHGNRIGKVLLNLISIAIILIGLTKISDILYSTFLNLDKVLFSNKLGHNQIAPTTSANFILIGGALFFAQSTSRILKYFFNLFLFASLFITLLSLCGYIINDNNIYTVKPFVPMALHTSVAFFLLIPAILFSSNGNMILKMISSDSSGGYMSRKLIPYAIVLPFILAYLRLKGQQFGLYETGFGISLQAASTTFILLALIWYNSRRLDKLDAKRKEAEAEINAAREAAEKANMSKTRFLSNMSHEIRTPLNGILGFTQILTKNDLTKEQREEYLTHIKASGELLSKLIGDILDLNKIEEGKLVLEKEPFHLKEFVESGIYPYKFLVNESGIEFAMEIDPAIPDRLIGDRHRINQMLVNLIGNSIKFTKEGIIGVRIGGEKINDDLFQLEMEIYDTGIGIEPNIKDRIFESFVQGNEAIGRNYGGSGLGLAIVKKLAETMGGSISVESPSPHRHAKGEPGSCFLIKMPMAIERTPESIIEHAHPVNNINLDGRQVAVLVVDDNLMNQRLAGFLLGKMGCKVEVAGNGRDAIEVVRTNRFDVILMDVQMPVMDGFEASQYIRNNLKLDTPIIGVTANVFKEDIEKCINAGMNDHLGKPYQEDQLVDKIIKWA